MKKLQLCLSLVALAFATNVHADLGPWNCGWETADGWGAYSQRPYHH